jgi:hypothetical protein
MNVLSLGWGVQSFTIAAMSALGDLPMLDYAVHADTGYEQAHTYAFAAKWTPWLEERGVKVRTVCDETGQRRPIDQWGGVMIPAFYPPRGIWDAGHLQRQCTDQWKRMPIRRFIRANGGKKAATLLLGISVDEVERSRPSSVQYITHAYPLLDKRMNRGDCMAWLQKHNLEIPHKSACYFCPFHRHQDWMNIKHNGNGDWQKCLETDEQIRNHKQTFTLYLHQSRRPLAAATDESAGVQMSFIMDDCTGVCWT